MKSGALPWLHLAWMLLEEQGIRLVFEVLKAAGLSIPKTPPIVIFGMKERALYEIFGRSFQKSKMPRACILPNRQLAIVTLKTAFYIASASGSRHAAASAGV